MKFLLKVVPKTLSEVTQLDMETRAFLIEEKYRILYLAILRQFIRDAKRGKVEDISDFLHSDWADNLLFEAVSKTTYYVLRNKFNTIITRYEKRAACGDILSEVSLVLTRLIEEKKLFSS